MAIGGWGPDYMLDSIEVINPYKTASKCRKIHNLPEQRCCYVVVGRGTICGGLGYDINPFITYRTLSSCLEYKNKTWTETGNLLVQRGYAASIELLDNTWWIAAGYGPLCAPKSSDIWKEPTNEVIRGIELPEEMDDHCIGAINSTHLFIAGNYEGDQKMSYILDVSSGLKAFDRSQRIRLNQVRYRASCGRLLHFNGDQNVAIVVGGGDGKVRLTTEIFNSTTKQWEEGPSLPRGFAGGAILEINGELLLLGGGDEHKQKRKDLMRYNNTTERFEMSSGELSNARYLFSAVAIQDEEEC